MEITVLCKVVDNFGDIGLVWRLCKQLRQLRQNSSINLIVDDLSVFNKINNQVKAEEAFQIVASIKIFDWKAYDFCYDYFKKDDGKALSVFLECFQCGRPDWMEKILFEDKLNRTVHCVMIDYLTAEAYAESFHCLKSLTRSARVQKVNFMPGFTSKTGGLIIDDSWKKIHPYNKNGPAFLFTYEKNWTGLAKALKLWSQKKSLEAAPRQILLAKGRGLESLKKSFNALAEDKASFNLVELNYLNQEEWDKLLQKSSVLFIRGEESMSRACLSGIPFVWHAYPQSEEYQLVKVKALLERLKNYFSSDLFAVIEKVWLAFNSPEEELPEEVLYQASLDFLNKLDLLQKGFYDFACDLQKNGDLVDNLMTFIEKNIII